MKIIQILFTLCSGGAERFVVNLSNELARKGHDVTIVTIRHDRTQRYSFNKQFVNDNVKYHSMGFGQGFSLKMMRKVSRYVKENNPDVVHCHLNTIPFILPLVFSKKIIVYQTIHTLPEKDVGSRLRYVLNKIIYRPKLVRAVVISKLCEESYEKVYGRRPYGLIINGSPAVQKTPDFDCAYKEITSYCEGQAPVFIHVARYNPIKNQGLLVKAFNQLYTEGIAFKLFIIGRDFNSSEAKPLVDSACPNIYFIGEKNNVGDYLLQADAFCLTSHFEGLPISLIEAMSAGVTPISTPVGGVLDVISDGITGYLSKDMSVEGYVEAIKKFIKSPIDKDVIENYYKNNYSIEKCADSYVELYKSK